LRGLSSFQRMPRQSPLPAGGPLAAEVRRILSNPFIEFAGSQVPGRGTEEMKTNDVKGTFLPGEVGVGIELGRPGVGAYFRDVERVGMALMKANLGYQMAAENPVTHFMTDKNTGKLRMIFSTRKRPRRSSRASANWRSFPKFSKCSGKSLKRSIRSFPWK